ncbi:putative membrane protein [Cricetibacter osteomyelitidis]|uniref:UPF0283 membrane protein EDC44_1252 n=1 Tax=Cricetibacter osteomyelitidis TaxID=1521931 RepID=A0A4R2SS48_9PAST|nr:TIGR01620 family protein [Cricetibacter osteomyelitidis]TCP92160.1 putative membrane protein [Cricetibacter osteomyelitidis]
MSKIIFEQKPQYTPQEKFMPKQEFNAEFAIPDPETENSEMLEGELFEQIVQPKPRWWKKVLGATVLLFLVASVAQSVQWLLDTYQQNQWIYFAFAIVSFVFVILGIGAILNEWKRLIHLKKRDEFKRQSQNIVYASQSAVNSATVLGDESFNQGKNLCLNVAKSMQLDEQHPSIVSWQNQINEAHSGQEVTYLFSQNVLQQIDTQAKKMITRHASEATVIVAISPLALVDMFFIAWRNIRLINQLAKLYGIELGYFSRIRLLRMVLLNIAFAGATELVHDFGMDWLSQDLTAKLSARAAQGIGIGLLTARLGIKTMEFCRPLTFQQDEKPRLNIIYRELLSSIKSTILGGNKTTEKEKVSIKN